MTGWITDGTGYEPLQELGDRMQDQETDFEVDATSGPIIPTAMM